MTTLLAAPTTSGVVENAGNACGRISQSAKKRQSSAVILGTRVLCRCREEQPTWGDPKMDEVGARRPRPSESRTLHWRNDRPRLRSTAGPRGLFYSRWGVGNREIAERADCSATQARRIIHRLHDGSSEATAWYPYYCRRGGPGDPWPT